MDSLPSRPLAVSERFGAIFVAHSSGFSVARMKDVMGAAEELKNGAQGSCIQELSVVDVSLGNVSILALSSDSSMLAASVGLSIYFFSVDGLLNKDHEPSYSNSLNGSSCIKDIQWSPHLEDRYVVLTRDGNLYCGAGQGDLNHVMDNVDAFNWSMNGKFIAVARYDSLSILSSKFEEKLQLKLIFDSLVDDDPDCIVKVDSVRWVRPDCIMLGCYSLSADGKEENNLIQLISVKDGKITNPSSSPMALTFRDAFLAINDDDIPSGSGPYTFISYLDEFELAFVANKKNTNQHIVLFNWSENGAAMIDIEVDSWVPTINLQVHNDADNMILGLAINKDYKDEKTILECGEIETKVSPCCILMCVTVDGRFCMFHFASAIGPSASPEDFSSVYDVEEESPVLDSQHPVMNIANNEKRIGDQDLQKVKINDQKVKDNEPSGIQDVPTVKPNNGGDGGQSILFQKKEGSFEAALFKASEPVNPLNQEVKINDQKVTVNEPSGKQQDAPTVKPNNGGDEGQSLLLQKKEGSFEAALFKASEPVNPLNQEVKINDQKVKDNEPSGIQDVPTVKPNNGGDGGQSLLFQKKEGSFEAALFKASEPVNPLNQEVKINDQKVTVIEPSGKQQDAPTVKPNNGGDEGQSLLLLKKEGSFEAALFKESEPVNPLNQEVKINDQKVTVNEPSGKQQDAPTVKPNNGGDEGQSLLLQKKEGSFEAALFKASEPVNPLNQGLAAVNSVSKSVNDKLNKPLFGASTELPVNKPSFSLHGSSGNFSSGSLFSSNVFGVQSSSSSGSFSSGGIFSSRSFELKPLQSSHAAVQEKQHDTSLGTPQFPSSPQKFAFSKVTSGSSTSSNILSQGAATGAAFSKSFPVSTFGSSTSSNLLFQGASTGAAFAKSFPVVSTSGSSTSSNLLPQGASTGAAFMKSLPVISNAQPSPAKSFDFKFSDKGNLKNQTPSRLLHTEPNLSEQHSVEEMAKELDALLDSIEQPGGFYHASVTAHKLSVAELEEGILVLSDRCRRWTDKMHQEFEEVQLLLDKTVQVLARKIYIEAIVKQATDSQYLDIWNHQKRRHILEINQNLTNQLIELERHLNTLELQRFGDKTDTQINRKSSHMKHNPPRHIQSLHSLHNTMNAQLTAAEKLSECLSKQMAVLNIDTEPVKKQNVKKELFDTIGISYDDTTFSSPGQEKTRSIPPKSQHLISSYSTAVSTDLKKSQQGAVKSSEPETARRRVDSLDKSWASIEPPKTTIKRMLLQEDRQMSPARLSLPTATPKLNSQRSVVSHDISHSALNMSQIRGSQDVQIKQNSEGQSISSLWGNYRSDSVSSGSQSTPIVTRDAAKEKHNLTAENSNRLTFALKSDPMVVKDPKFSQQSKSFPEPSLSTARSPAFNIFQKKPIEYSESKSTDGNQKPIVAETSSILSRKSPESSAVLSASSSTAFSGRSFSLEASTRESQSSSASLSVPVTLAPSSFSFKDTTSSSTSAISLGKSSTGFGFKLGATQTTPLSGHTSESSKPQVVSVPKFDPKPNENSSGQTLPQPAVSTPSGPTSQPSSSPSLLSFSSTTSTTKPTLNIDLSTSKSEPSKLIPDTSEISKPQVVSVPKFDPKPNESSSGQTLSPQPVITTPLGPTSQPPTTSISETQLNLNSKPDQPSVSPAPAVSLPVITIPVDVVSGQTSGSDLTVTQEDEMEEEAPDTTQFTLGNLGGFGLGSTPNPSAPKQNPFGAPFGNAPASTPITFTTPPSGGLFKPASFNVESQQPSQPPQQTDFGAMSGIFGGNSNQSSGGQGFGQPARIGSGQQALGSVLGSFGQSRQFGAGLPGTVASSPFGGGFGGSQTAGGFATASSGGGGFASLASGGGGGFGAAATGGGGFGAAVTGGGGFGAAATGTGGFGAAATGTGGFGAAPALSGGFGAAPALGGGFGAAPALGGGFAAAPAAGGGFGAAPAAGGGFAGVASGGFGGFSSQGGSRFSTFGSSGGTAKPPSELFTQMRK
ncbi:hypothetical protein L1987_00629 [Smallanthus sonchifolius]|uniref:Uncharacterized protein n=1 Tax=Smallanthus sonchifolius TaxID=185202 RepID=A0ACB9K2S8_9ASTR|nr:hypothetical protein L1987_00629 [Smallanthus sonchifolius]